MSKEKPRKIIFVDKKFQASFILKYILLILIGTAIFDIAAYFILNRQLGDTFYSAHVAIESVGEILLPALVLLSAVFIVVLGVAALIVTLYVSHKFSGPLYAIRRYLEDLGRGQLGFETRLRENDQSVPLARALAQTVTNLNERLGSIQNLSEEIGKSTAQLNSNLRQDQLSPTDLQADAKRLSALGTKLKEETGFFQTRDEG